MWNFCLNDDGVDVFAACRCDSLQLPHSKSMISKTKVTRGRTRFIEPWRTPRARSFCWGLPLFFRIVFEGCAVAWVRAKNGIFRKKTFLARPRLPHLG